MPYITSTNQAVDTLGLIHNRREMYAINPEQVIQANRLEVIPPNIKQEIIQVDQIVGPIPSSKLKTFDTGNAGVTSEGSDDTSIRGWAGATFENRNTAPFRYDKLGRVWATSAIISGAILGATIDIGGADATSFHVDIDGNMWLGAAAFADGTFSVTNGGSIKATLGIIGGWTIGETTLSASNLLLDSAGDIGTQDFASGSTGWQATGTGNAEFNNIVARGLIRTAVFQKDIITANAGSVLIIPNSDVLDTDMTALDASTLTIKGTTNFSVGHILRMKDGANDEWLEVTSAASAPTYTVTRDKASAYGADSNPVWTKGTAVLDYGVSGQGGLMLTASESNAPYMNVFTHAGSPWTTIVERLRVGNLNGFLGETSDVYGISIGEATKYLKYDPVNGLVIAGDVDRLVMSATGFMRGGQTDFATGDGWFLGFSGTTYKFSVGTSSSYFTFDGTNIKMSGAFIALAPILNANYTVANLPQPPTTAGPNAPSAYL